MASYILVIHDSEYKDGNVHIASNVLQSHHVTGVMTAAEKIGISIAEMLHDPLFIESLIGKADMHYITVEQQLDMLSKKDS